MFSKLYAITWTTFIETIRQPVFNVLLWTALFWMVVFGPSLSAYSLDSGKDVKILQDVALATILLYGLLASAFSAAHVISREIESRSILTVISKPVPRPLFLIGKFLGVSGALTVGVYLLALALLMLVRHGVMETVVDKFDQPVLVFGLGAILVSLVAAGFGNYVYGWHFTTALTAWIVPLGTAAFALVLFFGKQWEIQPPTKDFGNLQLFYALINILFAVLILGAFAIALATRFSQVTTLILCAAVFLFGLLSDYYLGGQQQPLLYQLGFYALPNFQYFWLGDPLTQDLVIPGEQVARCAAYATLYMGAVLALGIALFQTREVS